MMYLKTAGRGTKVTNVKDEGGGVFSGDVLRRETLPFGNFAAARDLAHSPPYRWVNLGRFEVEVKRYKVKEDE